MADNLNYFSDHEESECLTNIDPGLLDKSKDEKQLDDSEIPRPFHFVYFCHAFTRCLSFDSPFGLVKIQHNS